MTEPLEDLLDPDYVKKQAEPLLKIIEPLLEEEINRATVLVHECQQAIFAESGTTPRDDVIPATTLFLHIIETADGIRELLKEVCTDAATPLLRTLFESMLSLRFIVENIQDREVPMAWYVNSLKSRRKWLEGADPIPKSRKKRVKKGLAQPPTLNEKKRAKAIRDDLKRIKKRIEVDYKSIADKIRDRNWYTPYGGGSNLEQLASNLGFGTEYTFYRIWSARVHAEDTDFLIGNVGTNNPAFRSLRDPLKLRDYAALASTMFLNSIRTMAEGYCPNIDTGKWYLQKVRSLHMELVETKIAVEGPRASTWVSD